MCDDPSCLYFVHLGSNNRSNRHFDSPASTGNGKNVHYHHHQYHHHHCTTTTTIVNYYLVLFSCFCIIGF